MFLTEITKGSFDLSTNWSRVRTRSSIRSSLFVFLSTPLNSVQIKDPVLIFVLIRSKKKYSMTPLLYSFSMLPSWFSFKSTHNFSFHHHQFCNRLSDTSSPSSSLTPFTSFKNTSSPSINHIAFPPLTKGPLPL